MVDLTPVLRDAIKNRMTWTRERFIQTGTLISHSFAEPVVDWDGTVPEQWGRTWDAKGDHAAMVCLPLPLVVLTEAALPLLGEKLNDVRLATIAASNWSERLFCIEGPVLQEAFGLANLSSVLSPEGFSIDELWYATVA